jgi:hypothetical protein
MPLIPRSSPGSGQARTKRIVVAIVAGSMSMSLAASAAAQAQARGDLRTPEMRVESIGSSKRQKACGGTRSSTWRWPAAR